MKILGIDTSCDDTAIAILAMGIPNSKQPIPNIEILSNVVSSQVKLHAKYGGVYPTLAKREHQKNLLPALAKALKKAEFLKILNNKSQTINKPQVINSKFQKIEKILEREPELFNKLKKFLTKYEKPKIDAVAVTFGPGLEPCLWQGINFAKTLACWWNIPIVPVNHIEGHLVANFIGNENSKSKTLNPKQISFPAMGLVVSGGHTELILMEKIGKYKIIGETLDDAAGECFDKTARILGLEYPGGPAIARQAELLKSKFQNPNFKSLPKAKIQNLKIALPRPMINSKDFNFSFSGLKTAVLYDYKKRTAIEKKSKKYIQATASEIQQSIIDVLLKKTFKASKDFNVKTIILGGGVASNKELRSQFKTQGLKSKINVILPEIKFCMDNGAMVAIVASSRLKNKNKSQDITARGNAKIDI